MITGFEQMRSGDCAAAERLVYKFFVTKLWYKLTFRPSGVQRSVSRACFTRSGAAKVAEAPKTAWAPVRFSEGLK